MSNRFSAELQAWYLAMLARPLGVLIAGALLALVAIYFSTRFSFDASAETLVVEGDPDFAAYEEITKTFSGDDFLLITFSPLEGPLLSETNIERMAELQDRLAAVAGVSSVFSLLDAPLLKSPPVPLTQLAQGLKTLRSPGVDRTLAISELQESPLFRELLISVDGTAGAMRANFAPDEALEAITERRSQLRIAETRSDATREELARLDAAYAQTREEYLEARARMISEIRGIQAEFSNGARVHIGGVPMIAADMISFVKNDLLIFGGTVVLLIMAVLYLAFRQPRWVLLPVATAAATVLYTIGALGFAQKPATVISSNFVSLLLIMTISLIIHLIVRYRELSATEDGPRGRELVTETMISKFAPCLYTALTTIAAFGSLTVSNIVPVEDFGWMMCLGVAIAFVTAFTLFPAVLLLSRDAVNVEAQQAEGPFIRGLSSLSRDKPWSVSLVSLGIAVLAVIGISKISLDNRFIDYFQEDTEIYQGMVYIDQKLGGTVPFEVVLSFNPWEQVVVEDDFFADEADEFPERYWFSRDKLDRVGAVHKALEARPEVGKVVSMSSLDQLARQFTEGKPLSDLEIVGVLGAVPQTIRTELIDPYASPATGQMRLSGRVNESGPYFDREALVSEITAYAQGELGFEADEVTVSGMVVLFHGMLKELFASQRDTLVYVVLATFAMFLILLRSLKFALLGLVPNLLSAAAVLGFMGLAGIPLDMMTTTIAAISVGIGVDFAIHYLHRYRIEVGERGDAQASVQACHASIGRALYLTGISIIIGFSVLVFSNFVPTIMFGLLVSVAMGLALIANLSLLPSMLVLTHRDAKA